jgi:phosphopantothenoylcysteine decarboxylase/phosphopantothenate--cysteine ligase
MPLRCLVTAGPTREFFDPVRFISNPSSGKMGYALAAAAAAAGCAVDLVSGPVALPCPEGVALHPVVTGADMLARVDALFDSCDILIKAAAVCDFRPKHYSSGKVKKASVPLVVEFEPVVDILKTVAARKTARQTVVGFAAETDDIEGYAKKKLVEKNLDWVVANRVGRVGGGEGGGENAFESDVNRVILLGRDGARLEFGPAVKQEVARWLVETILGMRK